MKLTPLQKAAIKDVLTHGELYRDKPSDDFSPGGHRGQTIRSLIDKGLLSVTDESRYHYPLRVTSTPAANWEDALK